MMNGSTPPIRLHFLGTDRLLVSPQRAAMVPAAPHSRFLYALEAPIYAETEGPAGAWSSRLEARELTLVGPGERLALSSETGTAAEVVLISFDAAGDVLPRAAHDSRMPLRVRLPKVGLWLADLEGSGRWAHSPWSQAASGHPEAGGGGSHIPYGQVAQGRSEAGGRGAQRPCGQSVPGSPEALAAYFRMQSFLYEVAAAYLMGARQRVDAKAALLTYADQVRQEMNAHCDKPFDIEMLARQSGASPQRFYRAFRRMTGLSPHKYLTVLRLTRSLGLLATGLGSVAEVAHAVGYTDELYFSRLFKRAMGISPRQYIQCAREALAGAAASAGDLAPFGIAAAKGAPAQREAVQRKPAQGPAVQGAAAQGAAAQGAATQGAAAEGPAVRREAAQGAAVQGPAAQGEAPSGSDLRGLTWRQRIHRLGEAFGLEGVACFWLSLLDRKLENAAHLLRRRWGRAEFLLIQVDEEGYQLCGDEDRGVGELLYRSVGFAAPEAAHGLAQRPIPSLAEAAALGCPRAVFLLPSRADRSRLEAAWCELTQGQADAQCLCLTWDREDTALAYEGLVEQLTRLLLQPEP